MSPDQPAKNTSSLFGIAEIVTDVPFVYSPWPVTVPLPFMLMLTEAEVLRGLILEHMKKGKRFS
ncbi:hypothetical protein SDC9_106231 [bioreactor metagenome]|uniref:Uncharacterized protein n=1 Tax=bioreactor metagenome TaxID=1076179 RepID=A0A645B1V8_9ZZZZ